MEFPDAAAIDEVLSPVAFPPFAEVRYEPETQALEDVPGATRAALTRLALDDLPPGATVAVGLGSRGIHDVVPVAETVVSELASRGFEPVVVPAMGSHGGATPEGQRRTLASLGLTEEALGCPVDARMETVVLGESAVGAEVHYAAAAHEADAALVVNRVKAHTNFTGRFESGVTKMAVIGLGKQRGAQTAHEHALVAGYEPVIEAGLEVVRRETNLLGGVAVVENFYDRTAEIAGLPAAALPDAEAPLLERAHEYMPTLPFDELDVLVVDEIGKDVSGAGMDTNVVGRYRVLNAPDPERPAIKRIVVRGLTETTHGNGLGVGLADVTTADVAAGLDFQQMYANALTSNSLSKAHVPVVMPDDEHALAAAAGTVGAIPPEDLRVAWIRDTGHLSRFRVSAALVDEAPDAVSVERWLELGFEDGAVTWQSG